MSCLVPRQSHGFGKWSRNDVQNRRFSSQKPCYTRTNVSDVPRSLQSWVSTIQTVVLTEKYDRLNGWNSTLQAAWYIRHVRVIWFLWTKRPIWLLILSFTQNIVRACSMFYPYEGYRSVTPLDAARVNRTIFHNDSVHWYYITLIRVGVFEDYLFALLYAADLALSRWKLSTRWSKTAHATICLLYTSPSPRD